MPTGRPRKSPDATEEKKVTDETTEPESTEESQEETEAPQPSDGEVTVASGKYELHLDDVLVPHFGYDGESKIPVVKARLTYDGDEIATGQHNSQDDALVWADTKKRAHQVEHGLNRHRVIDL